MARRTIDGSARDEELLAVLDTSCKLWGDALVHASRALGVIQHVVDDQTASRRFLDARDAKLRAVAQEAVLDTDHPVAVPSARDGRPRSANAQLGSRRSSSAVSDGNLTRVLHTAKLLRGDADVLVDTAPPVSHTAAPSARGQIVRQNGKPLAVPERVRTAAAALGALGVRPGTTLGAFVDELADTVRTRHSGAAGAFMRRMGNARVRHGIDSTAVAQCQQPGQWALLLPADIAMHASCDAMAWALHAVTQRVDWELCRSHQGSATAQQLCVAAHTAGHALRLHADAVATLRGAREAVSNAERYRDIAMRAVLLASRERQRRSTSDGSGSWRSITAPRVSESLQEPSAVDWWVSPHVWELVHEGVPPPVFLGASAAHNEQRAVHTLRCTVRRCWTNFLPVAAHILRCAPASQSAQELVALATIRQSIQTEALTAAFQAGPAADLARLAVRVLL